MVRRYHVHIAFYECFMVYYKPEPFFKYYLTITIMRMVIKISAYFIIRYINLRRTQLQNLKLKKIHFLLLVGSFNLSS